MGRPDKRIEKNAALASLGRGRFAPRFVMPRLGGSAALCSDRHGLVRRVSFLAGGRAPAAAAHFRPLRALKSLSMADFQPPPRGALARTWLTALLREAKFSAWPWASFRKVAARSWLMP